MYNTLFNTVLESTKHRHTLTYFTVTVRQIDHEFPQLKILHSY